MTRVMVCCAALILPAYVFAQPGGPTAGPGDAAAHGARSLLVTPDGRVYAWDRNAPLEVVNGVPKIKSVAAGGRHALALTQDGDVFAWGANDAGQLGDGTNVTRKRPVRVRGLPAVVGVAAGRTHSLALTADGRVWAWGSNSHGQLGTGASNHSRVPAVVRSLPQIVSVDAGTLHSVAVSRSGDLLAWGGNSHGQLGDGTRRQRRHPVRIAIANVADVAAGATHTLAMDRDGAVFSWGSNSRGELGNGTFTNTTSPAAIADFHASAIRAGRRFSAAIGRDGALMAWGANDSGQLGDGSQIDRATPVRGPSIQAISILALGGRHAIAVSATGDVWTWGRNTVPSAVMSGVSGWGPPLAPPLPSPPTIGFTVTPHITTDWHTTPVTISFHCKDDSGAVSCPAPVTVTVDGASQVITGTAVDADGNHATTTATVNVDRTPPSLFLNGQPHRLTTTLSRIVLTGRVFDGTSGLAAPVLCNGHAAAVAQEAFECEVALDIGANDITLRAADVAGHMALTSVAITRLSGTPVLTIAPHSRTMVIGEVATLSLRNEFGDPVAGAAWSTADPRVAVLSDDEPPLVRGVGPGTTTISATSGGVGAEATITVDPGAILSPGTIRWTIAPTPGFTMQLPIFTHRVEPSVPDMFLVETKAFGTATLRAVTADGELLWKEESPGVPLMGDSFGGVIAGVLYDAFSVSDFQSYVRLGAGGGVAPWKFESQGVLSRPAQAAEGALYALEYVPGVDQFGDRFWDLDAIVIDGRTGQLIGRHRLPRDVDTFTAGLPEEGIICSSTRTERQPEIVGPIVGSDGRGYLLVRRLQRHLLDSCFEQTAWPQRTIDSAIDLIGLSPEGAVAIDTIHSGTCNVQRFARASCDVPPSLTQVVPDGIGGVLAVWRSPGAFAAGDAGTAHGFITRRHADGALSTVAADHSTVIDIVGQGGIVFFTNANTHGALDITTWTPKWNAELDGSTVLAAHPNGGAAILEFGGQLRLLNGDGQRAAVPEVTLALQHPIVQEFGGWIGLGDGQLTVVAGEYPDATRFRVGGNAQRQLAVRRPGLGIFAKSHPVVVGQLNFDHTSIRVVPTFQDFWKNLKPADFINTDEFGNHFMTIGAGTGDGDTSIFCTGTLTKGLNRQRDVVATPNNLEQLATDILTEMRLINDLYVAFDGYKNDLPYACVPEANPGFYNSNSFVSGILRRVQAPLPLFPSRGTTVPGWPVPVPAHKFDP